TRERDLWWTARADARAGCGHSALRLLLAVGEAELREQRATLVIVDGRRDDRDVHAARAVDLVGVDLVEHDLLRETERVVAAPVELAVRQTAEVADAGKRQ